MSSNTQAKRAARPDGRVRCSTAGLHCKCVKRNRTDDDSQLRRQSIIAGTLTSFYRKKMWMVMPSRSCRLRSWLWHRNGCRWTIKCEAPISHFWCRSPCTVCLFRLSVWLRCFDVLRSWVWKIRWPRSPAKNRASGRPAPRAARTRTAGAPASRVGAPGDRTGAVRSGARARPERRPPWRGAGDAGYEPAWRHRVYSEVINLLPWLSRPKEHLP